jgi:hypothetical protein
VIVGLAGVIALAAFTSRQLSRESEAALTIMNESSSPPAGRA